MDIVNVPKLSTDSSSAKSVVDSNKQVSIEIIISPPSPVVSRSQPEINTVDDSTSSNASSSVKSAQPFKVSAEAVSSSELPAARKSQAKMSTVDDSTYKSSSVKSVKQANSNDEVSAEVVISPPSRKVGKFRDTLDTVVIYSMSPESALQSKSRNKIFVEAVIHSPPTALSRSQSTTKTVDASTPLQASSSATKPPTRLFKPYAYYYNPSNETDHIEISTSQHLQPEASNQIGTTKFLPLESASRSEVNLRYCDPSDSTDPAEDSPSSDERSQTFKAAHSKPCSGSTKKVPGQSPLPKVSPVSSYYENGNVPPLRHIIINKTPPVQSPENYDGMRIRHGTISPNIRNDKDRVILTVNARKIDIFNITDHDLEYLDIMTDKDYCSFREELHTGKCPRKFKFLKVFDLNLDLDGLMKLMRVGRVLVKPFRLNVFQKGDFFTPHNDTDHPEVIGRLVLILPTSYTGGELCINQFNVEKTMPKKRLRFVFFDIRKPHSIVEVESGVRITLLYDVIDPASPSKLIKPRLFFSEVPREIQNKWFCDTVAFCTGKENILFGHFKYRNDLFYKLKNNLKKVGLNIIDVFVELNNPAVCYRVRELMEESSEEDEKGENKVLDLDDIADKYSVEHIFFPGESSDLESSVPAVETTGNEKNNDFEEEFIPACLINPVSDLEREKKLKRGKWYTPLIEKIRKKSTN